MSGLNSRASVMLERSSLGSSSRSGGRVRSCVWVAVDTTPRSGSAVYLYSVKFAHLLTHGGGRAAVAVFGIQVSGTGRLPLLPSPHVSDR